MAQNNSSFSTKVPTQQLAWDSTSLGNLKKCPKYYHYINVLGYTSPFESDHLTFGLVFHSATELYDRERANGLDHEASLLRALRYGIIATWDSTRSRPWASEVPTKTRNTLLRTIVWYLDTFKDDPLQTMILANGQPAVELSFSFEVGLETPGGEPYIMCGHIDRGVEWNGEAYGTDKKTTAYALDDTYFKQYSPDNQVSLYSVAGMIVLAKEIAGFFIDGAQILVEGTRFRRKPISRSPEVLEEWLQDYKIYMKQNETYVRNNHWPMNDKACGFGRMQCTFRGICSAEPAARSELLDTMFAKRIWDPIKPR